jgi:hypothetical protein
MLLFENIEAVSEARLLSKNIWLLFFVCSHNLYLLIDSNMTLQKRGSGHVISVEFGFFGKE